MAGIIATIQAVFTFLGALFKHLSERRLVQAGGDKADKEAAEGALELLDKLKDVKPGPIENDPDRRL